MLFRILQKVISCLIIRLRSKVCQLSVSTIWVVGLVVLLWSFATNLAGVVLNSFEVIYLGACMWVPNR